MEIAEMGKRLKKLRNEKELSRRQLSNMTNISPATLVGIEGGKRNPSVYIIAKISKALDFSIDEMVFGVKKAS